MPSPELRFGRPVKLASCDIQRAPSARSAQSLQYDDDATTAAKTHLVITLPTRRVHCSPASATPSAPFSCATDGELVGLTYYDRLENLLQCGGGFACLEPEEFRLHLPRVLSIVELSGTPSLAPPLGSGRADVAKNVTPFPAGWIDVNLFQDLTTFDAPVHELSGLDPSKVDLLGVGFGGFRGLPVLTLVLQEFFNGNVGGVFGNSIEAPAQVDLIPASSAS